MSCSTASTGACSLPAAAADSCWRDGPVASSIALDTLLGLWAWWGTAGPAYRELQPWEPSSLAHLSPLLPARLASCPRAPSPSPTSKLLSSCFITTGSPSRPAVALLPRPLWGVCPPDALWPRPPASHLPQGSLTCPLPGPPRWVGGKRAPEGGCTSPDPLQLIPSDRTSS